MSNQLFIVSIVEDRVEEQVRALESLKRAFNAEEDESMRFTIIADSPRFSLRGSEVNVMVMFYLTLKAWKCQLSLLGRIRENNNLGVLTDLMFPEDLEGKEVPNGLGVVTDCIDYQFPVVVCSDTDHHEVGYLRSVFPILGKVHPCGEIPVILDKKDWDGAIAHLIRLLGSNTSPEDEKSAV